jgi:hypothetical protein
MRPRPRAADASRGRRLFLPPDDLHNVRQRLGSVMTLHDRGELRTDSRPRRLTVAYHALCQQQGYGIGKRLIAGPGNDHPAGPIDDLAPRLR